jgi:hypothetical protein
MTYRENKATSNTLIKGNRESIKNNAPVTSWSIKKNKKSTAKFRFSCTSSTQNT